MAPDHLLLLVREPKNHYDDHAIAAHSASTKLGYVPRTDNPLMARMLDVGIYKLLGKVDQVRPYASDPWRKLHFSIYEVRQGW